MILTENLVFQGGPTVPSKTKRHRLQTIVVSDTTSCRLVYLNRSFSKTPTRKPLFEVLVNDRFGVVLLKIGWIQLHFQTKLSQTSPSPLFYELLHTL